MNTRGSIFNRRKGVNFRPPLTKSAFEFPNELPWVGMWGTTDTGRTGGMAVSNVQGDARRCPNDTREFIR